MFARAAELGFDDVSQADSDILVHLGADGISLSELARRRGITRQAVHQHVRGLVARGYVRLEDDPEDRRSKVVRRAARGAALDAALARIKRDMQGQVEAVLGPDALAALRRDLRRVVDAIGEVDG